VKGEKLSGTLEGVIFKITICDEGTINFEEVDTNVTDAAQRQRLIDDIDTTDVTGYAQKFVVGGIQFADVNGDICYLEVEEKKPIDKLKSLFDEEEKPSLSNKGMSFLDDLLGGSDEVESLVLSEKDAEIFVEAIENPAEPNEKLKSAATSYMEEQFRKMNEDKINELKGRVEDAEKEVVKLNREISISENKLKKLIANDDETRKKSVELFKQACQDAQVNFSIQHDKNIAYKEIIHESLYSDLLILNSKETFTNYEEKTPSRFIKNILEDIQCPVILVPEKFNVIEKIILLYDGTPASIFAIKMFNYIFPENSIKNIELLSIKKKSCFA
jgi:uncharacterized protein (DUF1778 family)